jgi:hypothetical protein
MYCLVLEPSPCLFEQLRIWPFHTLLYGRSEEWYTLLAVGHYASWHPKKTALLINRLFGGAKSLIARKDRGSAQVVVLGTLINQGLLSDFVSMYDTVDGSVW